MFRQHAFMQNRSTPLSLLVFAGLVFVSACQTLLAVEPNSLLMYDEGMAVNTTQTSPFLGSGPTITLWEKGVVKIAYNHAGARSDVSASQIMTDLQRAFAILEGIAELDFQFLGESSANPLDFNDDVVVVGWEQIDGSTIARAGPASAGFSTTVQRLGYLPAVDGSFTFNNAHEFEYALSTMIHELMHLLGVGHSDTPVSIMTPAVSRYDLPQADDIAVLQAMYGPPDVYKLDQNAVTLADATSSGIDVDLADSGLKVRAANAPDQNALNTVLRIDSSFKDDDELFYRLSYRGATVGDTVEIFLTDPNGFTSASRTSTIQFSDRISFFFVGFAREISPIAGDWTLNIGVGGGLVQRLVIPVDGGLDLSNRNPIAGLVATPLTGGQFSLAVNAQDPEGDALNFAWHIPGEGEFINSSSTFTTSAAISSPVKVLAAIRDDGAKRDGSSSGDGFSALLSQYLTTPAEPNIPTYFGEEEILHIPSILIGGTSFSVNFKLTKLSGIQFKFVELFPAQTSNPSSSIDLTTGVLTIPRLIVRAGGADSVFENLRFDLVGNANPIRFSLR
jgi:hypothetical protein